jgi:glutamyl-tRNA synthetase
VIRDLVQGDVVIRNDQLDDMILLRGDGTPTYMLSVVVDDHDMDVTHVIRGDDHLNNAARQMQLIQALDWPVPAYAHLPLIHGPDGAKLSKRHGAMAAADYRDMGYLPEAMRNYLLRLGWAHGDSEIVTTEEAIRLFDLDGIGRAPARLDFKKLDHVNGHYIRAADDERLLELTVAQLGREPGIAVDEAGRARLRAGMPGLKARARTIVELAEASVFYLHARPIPLGEKARALLSEAARTRLRALLPALAEAQPWSAVALETLVRDAAASGGAKLGELAQPLRAALTGDVASPPIFEVMAVLGRDETLGRIADALAR